MTAHKEQYERILTLTLQLQSKQRVIDGMRRTTQDKDHLALLSSLHGCLQTAESYASDVLDYLKQHHNVG